MGSYGHKIGHALACADTHTRSCRQLLLSSMTNEFDIEKQDDKGGCGETMMSDDVGQAGGLQPFGQ